MGTALSKVTVSTDYKSVVEETTEKKLELYEDFEHVPGEHCTFQQCSKVLLPSLRGSLFYKTRLAPLLCL